MLLALAEREGEGKLGASGATAKGLRRGCLGLALIGLLAIGAGGWWSYAGLQRALAHPPPHPRPQVVKLGPLTVMSGLTALDPCSYFGLRVDSRKCSDEFYAKTPGQPTAYRLWLLRAYSRTNVRAHKLVEIAVESGSP